MNEDVRISLLEKEGVMQAAKWVSHRVLLEVCEMERMFKELAPFYLLNVSEIVSKDSFYLSKESFLSAYESYLIRLKEGSSIKEFSKIFSAAFSTSLSPFYAMKVKENGYLVKVIEPVIQVRPHQFSFSEIDHTFHSMVHGMDVISWGLQFSFPQIYTNSLEGDVTEVLKNPKCVNTKWYKKLASWIRNNTSPISFIVDDKRENVSFRAGYQCFDWIENHPGIKAKGLTILKRVYSDGD